MPFLCGRHSLEFLGQGDAGLQSAFIEISQTWDAAEIESSAGAVPSEIQSAGI